MMAGRTFGTKLAAGFGLTVLLALVMAATSVAALRFVLHTKDDVITSARVDLVGTETLSKTMEARFADFRGFLVSPTNEFSAGANQHRADFLAEADRLRASLDDQAARDLLQVVSETEARHATIVADIMEERTRITNFTGVSQLSRNPELVAARQSLQKALDDLIAHVAATVDAKSEDSSARATRAIVVIMTIGLLLVLAAAAVAWRLSRDLRREVGAAVGHIQSSSAQLEAAAAQQVAGGRDQASAMNEITTTISELLITSRQIADSAQRVSKIAEDTAEAARTGDATIDQTRASIAAIRTQVDQIVQHMLALGEKSQQIGGVVDLVTELAEQTNILAINATIEASGAGEWGRRFAVVAEEIRKLADRTAGSAKEIRALIDDVRGAVNTTVMATEIGAKAVDSGSRQFDDATSSFRRIANLVATTNEATREIELSTKQQSTAVEQVNVAASDTARVTRETEASAVQTKQTAAHLTSLSGELLDLVGTGRH